MTLQRFVCGVFFFLTGVASGKGEELNFNLNGSFLSSDESRVQGTFFGSFDYDPATTYIENVNISTSYKIMCECSQSTVQSFNYIFDNGVAVKGPGNSFGHYFTFSSGSSDQRISLYSSLSLNGSIKSEPIASATDYKSNATLALYHDFGNGTISPDGVVASRGVITGAKQNLPTPLQLAELSQAVNSTSKNGIAGYNYLGDSSSFARGLYSGQRFAVYQSYDHSQIVLAISGTKFEISKAGIKTISEDTSFVSQAPSLNFSEATQDAALFLNVVSNKYPGANITLTGHSLGGATAELLSERSGLSATVFDAPGPASLYSSLSSELNYAPSGLGTSNITNYRLSDDQVSRAGRQFDQTTTISVAGGSPLVVSGNKLPIMRIIYHKRLMITQLPS